MAVIKLTETSSFENNFNSQTATSRINSLGLTKVYQTSNYTPLLVISDQKDVSLSLFEDDGVIYGTAPSKEIKDIKSFKSLGIQTIEGDIDYLPELAWVDSSCGDKVYVVDTKLNAKDNTQHVVKYDKSHSPSTKKTFTLDDVILQIDKQKICRFALSESRSYDFNYGGYPLTFYAINEQGEVLEFETKDYKSKIFANPQSLVWKVASFNKKEGFVRLTENSTYWGSTEELIYAFGLEKSPAGNFFCLELVNASSLQPGAYPGYYHSAVKQIPNKVKLDFGSHIDFNLNTLPCFDSASCLDDKEFLVAMIPVVNGKLDNSCRDLYWFRLKSSRDEAILLADPYRLDNIDRFDSARNRESPVWVRHTKNASTSEDIIYLVAGQNSIKKFKLDLTP